MKAGQLRHRVTIQTATETRDAIGGVVAAPSVFAAVWASIEALQGREYLAAQQVNAEVDHQIRIRYRAGVTPKMRVVFGARLFDVRAVLNPDGRNRELLLMAKEAV